MHRRVWFFCVLVALMPSVAQADQTQLFIGASTFTGRHETRDGIVRNTAVAALPDYALRVRHKQFEFLAEEVPPIGPIRGSSRYGNSYYATTVGYTDAGVRYWLHGGRLALGAGDSLYVSQSRYLTHEHEAVRAAGMRFELAGLLVSSPQARLVASVAVSPSMHQRSSGWFDDFRANFRPVFGTGSLVDGSLQVELPRGGGHAWVYGVRYLNYTGGNHEPFDGLKERTGVIAAFAAWGFTLRQ